jgi:hypothetical protein
MFILIGKNSILSMSQVLLSCGFLSGLSLCLFKMIGIALTEIGKEKGKAEMVIFLFFVASLSSAT